MLDFLRFFTIYATDKKHRKIKIIARFQQFQATNLIVDRVLLGKVKQGLIWHFQGSGKSLLMVFTALKLRAMAGLSNPTILIVVDRIDLDTQITGTFNASDVPGLVSTDSRAELQELLSAGARKVIITTIHKFGEAPGVLDARDNIIVMVDEAHRTQEGDYGRKMREALPNAFLFGLTGTPINRRDRNTFMWFGSPEDEGGYLSRYSFQDSIRDGATLPLALRAAPVGDPHRPGSHRRRVRGTGCRARSVGERQDHAVEEGRLDRGADQGTVDGSPRSPPTSRSTSRPRSSPRGSRLRSSPTTRPRVWRIRRSSTSTWPPRPRRS